MEYVEPPPKPVTEEEKPKGKFPEILITPDKSRKITVQKAQVRDVQEILDLINGYAADDVMLPRGPQYVYENIRDFVIAVDQNVPIYSMIESHQEMHLIVACGSLHVLWEDIGEIRALAVHPKYQDLGLGRKLLENMIVDAKDLGIRRLYTFTLTAGFFEKLGFVHQERDQLPPKMWGECSRCPKYFKCDEVGMLRLL